MDKARVEELQKRLAELEEEHKKFLEQAKSARIQQEYVRKDLEDMGTMPYGDLVGQYVSVTSPGFRGYIYVCRVSMNDAGKLLLYGPYATVSLNNGPVFGIVPGDFADGHIGHGCIFADFGDLKIITADEFHDGCLSGYQAALKAVYEAIERHPAGAKTNTNNQ